MKLRVLHLLPYEKYVVYAIRLWNKMDVSNRYLSVEHKMDKTICEVEDEILSISPEDAITILEDGRTYDVVVLHSMDWDMYDFVLHIPNEKIVIWQSVGYDIYESVEPYVPLVHLQLYKPINKAYIDKVETNTKLQQKTFMEQIRYVVANCFRPRLLYHEYKQKWAHKMWMKDRIFKQKDAWRRIDYISTVLWTEYDIVRKSPYLRAQHFSFQYIGPFEEMYGDYIIDFKNTKYLQIGNSADPTNNHLDVISVIHERGITTELFIPIAYGGDQLYKERIKMSVKSDNCLVQEQYINRQNYNRQLHQCRAAIFGHLRQQALGNIFVLLMQGCRLFFYKDSITYKYFKTMGAYVNTIEDDLSQQLIDTPLSQEQIMRNRNLFAHQYDDVISNMRKQIADIQEQIARK